MTQPPNRVVTDDLIRRLRAGELRYRLPDGTLYERPFPSNNHLKQRYGVSGHTIAKVRAELVDFGWIVPGERPNEPYRLAEQVLPIARVDHPPVAPPRRRPGPAPGRRAHEIAGDLLGRVIAGEFSTTAFPWLVDVMGHYNAAETTVRAAFDQLHRDGWIEFRYQGANRIAVLADPLPDATTRAVIQVWVYTLAGTAAEYRSDPDGQNRSLAIVRRHNLQPTAYQWFVALPRDLRRPQDIAHTVTAGLLYPQRCTLFVYLTQDGNPGLTESVWLDFAPPAGTAFTAMVLPPTAR